MKLPKSGQLGELGQDRPRLGGGGECLPGAGDGGGHGVPQSGGRVRPGPGGRCPALPLGRWGTQTA